jgi:hypothetical protein
MHLIGGLIIGVIVGIVMWVVTDEAFWIAGGIVLGLGVGALRNDRRRRGRD